MVVDTFLRTAAAAEVLLASPAVAEAWERPSALDGYRVGGLAGHLARAVLTVVRYLDEPVPDADRPGRTDMTDAAGYFVRVLGADDPVHSDLHRRVRRRGEEASADGQAALVERVRTAREDLARRLTGADPGRPIAVLDGCVLSLEDYLRTRLVELVVHLDDLAVSVDRPGPDGLTDEAYEIVAAVLARIAARRGGHLATVRGLARRERHPEAVRAL